MWEIQFNQGTSEEGYCVIEAIVRAGRQFLKNGLPAPSNGRGNIGAQDKLLDRHLHLIRKNPSRAELNVRVAFSSQG